MIVGLQVGAAAVAMIVGLQVAIAAVAMIVDLQAATAAVAMIVGLQAATAAVAMIVERAIAEAVMEAAETEAEAAGVRKAGEEDLPAPGLVESKCKRDVADSECQPQAKGRFANQRIALNFVKLQVCPSIPGEQGYHTPLSLPVILKATAAADASGGNRLRRNVAGTSPRNAVSVSWRVYRRAP